MPPEISFHRFFPLQRNPEDLAAYRGRYEVERAGALQPLLHDLYVVLNRGLTQLHGYSANGEPRLYFDYVDATKDNALAFTHDGIACIGVTFPLVESLLTAAQRLARAAEVQALFGLDSSAEERLLGNIFATSLIFVVGHEYGHHRLGHRQPEGAEPFHNELYTEEGVGNLERQANETNADGLGVFLLLNHLITGQGRAQALALLDRNTDEADADLLLLRLFIMGVGAFFLSRHPRAFDPAKLYEFTHPPLSARMNYLMAKAQTWAQSTRPVFLPLVTQEEFQHVMAAAERALWGDEGAADWYRQYDYFRTAHGKEYFTRLEAFLRLPFAPDPFAAAD